MADFNPRNANRRYDQAPLSWSQRFYDQVGNRQRSEPVGFRVPDKPDA